jgi:hypothetical protein
MNRVNKTTVNQTSSVVEVSEHTPQMRSGYWSELSTEMTDAQAVRECRLDDPALHPSVARTVAASSRRRRAYPKNSSVRSPHISASFLKWLLNYLSQSKGWMSVLTVAAVCGWWNGQLLTSTGLGIGVMILAYRTQFWDWQLLRSNLEQFWDSPNRHFVLAIGSGGIATLGTYMSFEIWAESENHWIAVSAILQNVGTIAIVALLLQQAFNHIASKDEAVVDRILADLTDADPVKRLIAVRQITDLVNNPRFCQKNSLKSSIVKSHTTECLRLMLSREPETIVRNALLEGLQALDTLPKLN